MAKKILFLFILFVLFSFPHKILAEEYYLDCQEGNDNNSGTSINFPWKNLSKVNSFNFLPGDTVLFKKGCLWQANSMNGLTIYNSGEEGNPITYKSYSQGNGPIISVPGSWDSNRWSNGIEITGSWIVIEDLLLKDAHYAGVVIRESARANIINNIEVTNTGCGVSVAGQDNLIANSYFHDLKMIYNSPGGDDDFGATGVALEGGSNNEISYNRMANCLAPSYDYQTDGGAVELFADVNNNYIHHNWAENNDGFFEIGGTAQMNQCFNNIVAYNVSVDNNGTFCYIHLAGGSTSFGSNVQNLRVENNTIVERTTNNEAAFRFSRSPTADEIKLRNNIVYSHKKITNLSGFFSDYNIFYTPNNSSFGFSPGSHDLLVNPQFVGLTNNDFHLLAESPAINAGLDLGYSLDFDKKTVPSGLVPDIGAFEYQPQTTCSTLEILTSWLIGFCDLNGDNKVNSLDFNLQLGS